MTKEEVCGCTSTLASYPVLIFMIPRLPCKWKLESGEFGLSTRLLVLHYIACLIDDIQNVPVSQHLHVCAFACVSCSGSEEGVSLPEVAVNISGKVLRTADLEEWDDKQVRL